MANATLWTRHCDVGEGQVLNLRNNPKRRVLPALQAPSTLSRVAAPLNSCLRHPLISYSHPELPLIWTYRLQLPLIWTYRLTHTWTPMGERVCVWSRWREGHGGVVCSWWTGGCGVLRALGLHVRSRRRLLDDRSIDDAEGRPDSAEKILSMLRVARRDNRDTLDLASDQHT